jgi:hypothetical protein
MHGCSTLFRVPLTPPITATLNARVEALQVKLAKVEASAVGHRADFEPLSASAPIGLMTELLRATADTLAAMGVPARLLPTRP